jgi:hypothetical protein
MWGIALLHTLQDFFVFGFYGATVHGDVVKCHADLFLG